MSEALAEWGLAGVEALHTRVAVLVIVDVLSFCTAVDVAVSRGALVEPFGFTDERIARAVAERSGAVLAGRRFATEGYSLWPSSQLALPPRTPRVARLAASLFSRAVCATPVPWPGQLG